VEIITRKEAREKCLKRYFTGKSCPGGHISERLVSNAACCACLRNLSAAYYAKNRRNINDKKYAKQLGYEYEKRQYITSSRRAIEDRLERKKLDQSLNLT
jgi:hypothetical protein